ncbi:hypothetical protein M9Y10_044405 [Tritrichomonas musculus]|uniref:Homeobox domain-containing protein n=1 Tax=Tritrichomonas musculus TaxID=1915356 RepID=A0ABR2JSQ7_9EUKA
MFQQQEDDYVSSARYYASPQEQKILIQGLQRYFSLPERSQNRNKIAKEVSTILRMYSPHWTHRAVRLWFNNNKHTYLPTIPGVGNVVPGGNVIDNNNVNNPMNVNNIPMKNPMNNNYYMNMNLNSVNGMPMNPQMQIPQIPMAPIQQQMPQDNSNIIYIQGNMMNNQMMQMPQYPQMNMPMAPPLNPQQMQVPMPDHQQMLSGAMNPMNSSKATPKAKTIKINKSEPSTKVVLPPISMTSPSTTNSSAANNSKASVPPSLSPHAQQNGTSLQPPIPTSPLIDSPDTVPIAKDSKETKCVTNPPMKFSNATPSNTPSPSYNQMNKPSANSDQMQQSGQMQSVNPNDESDNQLYSQVCSILNEIRNIDSILNNSNGYAENNQIGAQLLNLIDSFDDAVFQLATRIGSLNPEMVEPTAKFVRISFPIEPSSSIYNFLNSSSNMRLDSTSFSNMMPNDMSISYLMFPESMSNFDLTNPMFPRMPSTPSFNQLQMGNDPSFSSFKDFSNSGNRSSQTNGQSSQQTISSGNANSTTTNDGNSIVNSNSGSDSESEKEDQDKSRTSNNFQFSQASIFQTRQFIDEKLTYFEAHALNDEYAAYTSSYLGATQRTLYVIKYKEKMKNRILNNVNNDNDNDADNSKHNLNLSLNNGNAYAVESSSAINSLAIDHDNAWMLSKGHVIKVPFTLNGIPQTTISIFENKIVNGLSNLSLNFSNNNDNNSNNNDGQNNEMGFYEDGIIATYQSGFNSNISTGAVVGFPSSNNLFFVNGNANSYSSSSVGNLVTSLSTKYSGFRSISNMYQSDRLICAISKSATIRMISPQAAGYGELEERCFVGHCGQVLGVEPLSDCLFASRGDDETVRLWDIRERGTGQVSTITTPHVSPISITGNGNYVICGYHNKYICVVDLRMDCGVPILGVPTQEYSAIAMNYSEEDDALAMIGVVDKESVKDSMVFAEMSGQSRLRILRYYSNFIGQGEDDDKK